ncbi:tRNA-adenosine deaminase [Dethiosulfatibacter aminovorans DSM 17477]|uniref:tRNA-specific adenosine deaminase n=1 Tax=Dethiosulfatibacter aminovorans DSM 17477 TaxID=1121476 RepID=A0A1M6B235_9FIRM|nr:tRNA adenosine(34) deaminase TadA [Dethiosulfatibacter aminovorans]SHI42533.1 tRNA-adenosine deaminase [Dethiosulfatibacter aminovorans DSM 17477]
MVDYFMKKAILEAEKAYDMDEVPVGAVVVKDGKIIGRGFNQKELAKDATKHAEILAINEACKTLNAWRLTGCTMYVTLEPCAMCAGALVNSRIDNLIIGARDPKTGACGSVFNIVNEEKLNHGINVEFGVMEDECSTMLKDFFKKLRSRDDD